MPDQQQLTNPWLLAVWPGMGNVAINSGFFLMSKLGMYLLEEFNAEELFDVDHVVVEEGLIRTSGLPRSRIFIWNDPSKKHDLVLFIGEKQPPIGKYAFCHKLIDYVQKLSVERVFTFAAMATQVHAEHESRVFGAATDRDGLEELKRLELELLKGGHIGGLNGVLLGAAAQADLRGMCLLGEMPHIFAQLPFPQASQAVLEVFTTIAGIEMDFSELSLQASTMRQHLGDLLTRLKQAIRDEKHAEGEPFIAEPESHERLSDEDRDQIEQLFENAKQDRSAAYELKRELDRINVFGEYEDRFLDLFQKPGD